MKISGAVICLLFAFSFIATADTITYKESGRKIEVIIEKETPTDIWARGGTEGKSSARIPKSVLEKIEYATPEENDALEKRWQKEEQEKRTEREMREKFEEEQKAKGLVEVDGSWVPLEEAETAKQDKEEQERQQEKKEEPTTEKVEDPTAPAENAELREFLEDKWGDRYRNLSEEQKQVLDANIQKIRISSVSAESSGPGNTNLRVVVTNTSDVRASWVRLNVSCYDKAGKLIFSKDKVIRDLPPRESRTFYGLVDVDYAFVDRVDVRVLGAL